MSYLICTITILLLSVSHFAMISIITSDVLAFSLITTLTILLFPIIIITAIKVNKVPKKDLKGIIDDNDDNHWKLGLIYFNKNDRHIFVSKRTGLGYTLNYARPLAWLFIIVFIALISSLLLFIFSSI